jgi:hypothetical protein
MNPTKTERPFPASRLGRGPAHRVVGPIHAGVGIATSFGRDAPAEVGAAPFDDRFRHGVSAMNRARFWTGTLMLAGPAMAIILALSPEGEKRYGAVEGTVTYRGRPVHGGMIFFLADGWTTVDAVHTAIDKDGHFRCDPSWTKERAAPKRFRICVVLNQREYPPPPEPQPAEADDRDEYPGDVPRWRRPAQEDRPAFRLVRASWQPPGPDVPEPPVVRRPRKHRFSDPKTTNLAVRLDRRPARLDIELTD